MLASGASAHSRILKFGGVFFSFSDKYNRSVGKVAQAKNR